MWKKRVKFTKNHPETGKNKSIRLRKHPVGFKKKPRGPHPMPEQEVSGDAGLHGFLDALNACDLLPRQQEWFNVDVAAMFASTPIHFHELDRDTGKSLLFLKDSLTLLCPQEHVLHHFPRHLIHCFVDDRRHHVLMDDDPVFRAELFSISPLEEQLCWVAQSANEPDVPALQSKIATWLAWLNRS
jgi:hypothetical protein